MTPENFCYWLRGFIELSDPTEMDSKQMKIINDHLDLVMKKVTPTNFINTVNTQPYNYMEIAQTC